MTDFIKISAMIGLFTMYVLGTGLFGGAAYKFLKDEKETVDYLALSKGLFVAYAVGIVVFMFLGAYYVIYRG